MTRFRWVLFAGLFCLTLGQATITLAADDGARMDFETAASFIRKLVQVEDEIAGLQASMLESDDVTERRRYEIAAREIDDKVTPTLESIEIVSLLEVLLSEPDVDRFSALVDDLSPWALSWLLTQSVESGLEFRQGHIPLALALLEDERDRLALSPPGVQRLNRIQAAAFEEVGLEIRPASLADLVWQSVLRLLPIEERTEVVRDAFSGSGFDLIARRLRLAIERGELNDMALDFEPEWLLEKIQENAHQWQPLFLHANLGSGDDQLGKHFETLPEAQQIRLLAKNSDEALMHHFERLGEWLLAQDSDALGRQAESVSFDLMKAALNMDTPSSLAWLEMHMMELPRDDGSLRYWVETFARYQGKTAIPAGLQLSVNEKYGRLQASPEQWLTMHQQEPERLSELVRQLLPEMAMEADDSETSLGCRYEMALAYMLVLDQDYPVPELDVLPNGDIQCAAPVLQMAGQFDALALLDWVIDGILRHDPTLWDHLALDMAAFESEALSERVLWRLQDTPAWDRLSLGVQHRLLDQG